ncbi:hypothetical protein ORJ66_21200 [Pseudoalteromonas tunicata]|uniref:hypothetical protein n=1 Tax=Pseudoalteromonas tunicata TaxID=314281 RepID=UPI00273F8BE3|nr:hypothetical protein [Pseudoalteromonas tunicata]MDP5215564.1 hypothetical protein [Pseudoalteromonas tunicata]
MSEQKINPNQVTKPIQLLAAWLVGLILINGSFLGAAKVITVPSWAPGLLVIAAVINVPIFLGLIFFLQTKFRAELQEDTFYSKHLEKLTGQVKERPKSNDALLEEVRKRQWDSNSKIDAIAKNIEGISESLSNKTSDQIDVSALLEQVNETRKSLSSFEEHKIKQSTRIAINDLIPNYKEIAKKVIRLGYPISETFGSTSKDKKPPKYLTISFIPETPKNSIVEIYKMLKPYGFQRIDYDNMDREPNESNIYIGSYIDSFPDSRKSIEIDDNIEELIFEDNVSSDELGEYIVTQRA